MPHLGTRPSINDLARVNHRRCRLTVLSVLRRSRYSIDALPTATVLSPLRSPP
ncbi:hypothetical protein [Leptolyngbya iicbica]|uniref:Uncharacterized protein n=1 Tax=Lyngbya confervoides BDU141951 TaxID=1574623 RepID=A0A8T6QV61_9CYAN|nr:hypothetical protein [Leptolyngbya sp. LK]